MQILKVLAKMRSASVQVTCGAFGVRTLDKVLWSKFHGSAWGLPSWTTDAHMYTKSTSCHLGPLTIQNVTWLGSDCLRLPHLQLHGAPDLVSHVACGSLTCGAAGTVQFAQ